MERKDDTIVMSVVPRIM